MTATTSSVSTDIAVAEPVFTRQEQLVLAGFLAGYTGLTRDAYALDLRQYANWCQQNHLRLFQVRRADIECFAGVPPAMTWGCPGKHVSRPNRVIGTRPPWRSATVPEFRSDYGRATDAFTLRDQVLKQFLEAGTYRALIDRCCPLEQAVDATRYAETKQTTGKAVLAVRGGRGP